MRPTSTTRNVRLGAIADKGGLGSVLIRLMMVMNDMSLAMDGLARWTGESATGRQHREIGARIYFARLQLSHLYEGLKIVKEIDDDRELTNAVDASGEFTRICFAKLLAFRKSAEYEKIMGRIRNNLTFHYDPKTIFSALEALAAKNPDIRGSLTLGDDPVNWFCEPGDLVGDRATVREIFKVPDTADVREEVDKIVLRLHDIMRLFGGFAGGLIWESTSRTS
jgi:hypothetical protein